MAKKNLSAVFLREFLLIFLNIIGVVLFSSIICQKALALGYEYNTNYGAIYDQAISQGISAVVVNEQTGKVLVSINPYTLRYPASLTKLMTLYLAFQALSEGKITLNTEMPVSVYAASQQPFKLWLTPGSTLSVSEAIQAMVTLSANDAASVLGQYLGGGSVEKFVKMMNAKARAFGMLRTHFSNANGLPAPGQYTDAYDLAILARHIENDFPQYYHYFSLPEYNFRGRILLNNDNMLWLYPGITGFKTGFISTSMWNLINSATRGKVTLIGVLLHTPNVLARNQIMATLLNRAFVEEGVSLQGNEWATRLSYPGLPPFNDSLSVLENLPVLPPVTPPLPFPPIYLPLPPVYNVLPLPPTARILLPLPPLEKQTSLPWFVIRALDKMNLPEPPLYFLPIPPIYRLPFPPSLASSTDYLGQWSAEVGVIKSYAYALSMAHSAVKQAGIGYPAVAHSVYQGKSVYRALVGGLTKEQAYQVCGRLYNRYSILCFVILGH